MPRGHSFAGYAGSDPFKERSENRQHPNGVHASDLSRQRLEDATTVDEAPAEAGADDAAEPAPADSE